jgi:uncharacterized metal-binding protein YceD (DUF177 family)
MDALQDFYIPFVGLKLGKHNFSYHIDDKFFDEFQYEDFNSIECDVKVTFNKKPRLFELDFDITGFAMVNCDLSFEEYKEKIDTQLRLIVKFGNEYNDENEEVLILPHSEYQVNIAQYIYEAIVLALPLKRVHPGIEDGTLKSEVLDKLKEFEIRESKQTDPRWDKLNELLTQKKQ